MSNPGKSLLICGESGSGKSTSLMNLTGHEGVLYINCEGGKPLPFKNNFKHIIVDDPYEVYELLEKVNGDPQQRFHTVIIDTISFLMDRFESCHVNGSANTMKAWGDYGNYFRELMQTYVAQSKATIIFLGHLDAQLNEESGQLSYTVPVKGALKKNGIEAYFTTVVNCRKVKISTLDKDEYDSDLLNITDRERMLGFKHVFQTLTTKETVGDRIRSPMGFFEDKDTYIDNDAQIIINRLDSYYRA